MPVKIANKNVMQVRISNKEQGILNGEVFFQSKFEIPCSLFSIQRKESKAEITDHQKRFWCEPKPSSFLMIYLKALAIPG